jgi:hypothetical protein
LNHFKWDHAVKHGLIEEILKPDAEIRSVLNMGFYRLVVLDAARRLCPAGVADVRLIPSRRAISEWLTRNDWVHFL